MPNKIGESAFGNGVCDIYRHYRGIFDSMVGWKEVIGTEFEVNFLPETIVKAFKKSGTL